MKGVGKKLIRKVNYDPESPIMKEAVEENLDAVQKIYDIIYKEEKAERKPTN